MSGEEDFIALGDADDYVGFENASDEESDESFDPSDMTLATFHKLLECYPGTVQAVYRRKAIKKAVPQPTKGAKKRAQREANTTEPVYKEPTEDDLDKSQKNYVDSETDKFLQLNDWRYDSFPAVLKERDATAEGKFMDKVELMKVMEWKTKHGLPRPTLMGMLKTNKEKVIHSTTASAFKQLSTVDPMEEPNEAFPKTSMDTLSGPLRGIGPATASLILSIATTSCDPEHEVPFYSDDIYLWLCLEVYPFAEESDRRTQRLAKLTKPNGELNVKYNMHEYRELWNAVWELRARLNRLAKSDRSKENGLHPVSSTDIEKVAFVIRHIRVSGYPIDLPEEDTQVHPLPQPKETDGNDKKSKAKAKAKAKAQWKKERKRKREDEAETKPKPKKVRY